MLKITGYIEKDAETGLYVAIVPGIPGAHTQADSGWASKKSQRSGRIVPYWRLQ